MVHERRNKFPWQVALLIAAVLIAVLPSRADNTTQSKPAASKDVEVYNGPTAPKPFIVIGEIHAKGSTEKSLMTKMKSIARQNGANAILSYEITAGVTSSYWTGAVLSNAEGVAVRWSAEGEEGVTRITADMSIPVIQ